MSITTTVWDSLLAKLVIVWGISLIAAYFITTQFAVSLFQVAGVLAMLGTLGIFILQYDQTIQPPDTRLAEPADYGDEAPNGEERSSNRGEPTADLSAAELRAQNELIRTAFQAWKDSPLGFSISRPATHLIQEVAESLGDVDEDTLERVWRLTIDDGFFKRAPGGNVRRPTPKAIWRAEALGEDNLLDEEIREEILTVLFQAYRENPAHAPVGRDELIDALARSEDEVDQNVWWLKEKRYIETNTAMGIDAGYYSLEITDLGRKVAR